MSFFSKKPAAEPQNLDEIIAQFNELKISFQKLRSELESLKTNNQNNLQKIGVVRFNPFEGLGGNQSFSIAILDGKDNGMIITSLFTRDGNRVYGKPVKLGSSEFKLTEEETKAIQTAHNGNQ